MAVFAVTIIIMRRRANVSVTICLGGNNLDGLAQQQQKFHINLVLT